MWKEFFADKTDPQGRASMNKLKQLWELILASALCLALVTLIGLGKISEGMAWVMVVLILGLLGVKEVNAIVQKVTDAKVKDTLAKIGTKTTTPNPSPQPAAQMPSTAPPDAATAKTTTATGDSTRTGGAQ